MSPLLHPAFVSPTAIVGARLVDVVHADVIERSVVVIDPSGRIAAAGPQRTMGLLRTGTVIEADGLTLVPGLIDCHAHLALRESWKSAANAPTATERTVAALEAGRRWVEHGVTTVRDAWGATAGLRSAFQSSGFAGPRLQISTGLLRSSAIQLGRGPFGRAMPSSDELPMEAADGEDAVRRAARLRIAAGADWIKIRAAGWTMDPEREPLSTEFTIDELRAAVDEARAAGIRGVMAHTQGPASISNALAAGIRSIEHGDLVDADGVELMLRSDAVLAVQGPIDRGSEGSAPVSSITDRYWELQRTRIRVAAAAGIRIVLGSDALGDGLPHAVIAHLADCGLGPMGAIAAASIAGARLLDLADETGSIEPGKQADLLLFQGNPTVDATLWNEPERVVFVMLGGQVVVDRRGSSAVARGAVQFATVPRLQGSGA